MIIYIQLNTILNSYKQYLNRYIILKLKLKYGNININKQNIEIKIENLKLLYNGTIPTFFTLISVVYDIITHLLIYQYNIILIMFTQV